MRRFGTLKKPVVIWIIASMIFTALPMTAGTLDAYAAAVRAPAQVKGLTLRATNYKTVRLAWNKIPGNRYTKGYAIYRNGKFIKRVNRNTRVFSVTSLSPKTRYYFRVRAYNTYKYTQYYNTTTWKWQTRRPAAGDWLGRKTRKVVGYKFGKMSAQKAIVTPAKPDKDPVFTKASLTGPKNVKPDRSQYDYITYSSGNITWSVSDKSVATIESTAYSPKFTTRACSVSFKKDGTVKLSAKSALNGKTKTITIVSGNGGSSSDPSGGDPQPTGSRTRLDTVNYLGRSFTIWKDSNDNYWDSETGGNQVNRAVYDTTVDGEWMSGAHKFIQRSGTAVGGIYYNTTNMQGLIELEVYNGDVSKASLIIRENTKKYFTTEGDDFGETYVLDENGNRFAMFESDPSIPNKIRFNTYNPHGFDGYVGGTVHIDGYYDFNGNGILSADELIGSREITIETKPAAEKAYELAQEAVEYYGTSTYEADMAAINAYLFRFHSRQETFNDVNMFTCIGGANILKAWSIRHWGVFGTVYQVGNTAHEMFFPEKGNPYTVREKFEADGYNEYYGQVPGTLSYENELALRESTVAELKAAGK